MLEEELLFSTAVSHSSCWTQSVSDSVSLVNSYCIQEYHQTIFWLSVLIGYLYSKGEVYCPSLISQLTSQHVVAVTLLICQIVER